MTNPIPSYIPVPPSGQVITEPKDLQPPTKPRPPVSARPSFPPAASNTQQPAPRKFNVPTSALSTNVSDLLLSSLLPPNLPKLPASVNKAGDGRVRELSTQREALSLPLVSNNFRRFVTKVGLRFSDSSVLDTQCIELMRSGRTGILDAGSYRRSPFLAETNLDICLHASMGFHLYAVFLCRFDRS
jgi:hypothetical protein